MFTNIISVDQLDQYYQDTSWVIVDCRFELLSPDWGFADYQRAHIPGAVYAHLDKDLAAPITPQSGRHPLPSPESFNKKLEEWGILPASQVVVYDTSGGGIAGRLWWMLRLFNHMAVALLDGGFQKWVEDGHPVRGGIETREMVNRKIPDLQPDLFVNADGIERMRQDPNYRLIDARTPERYRGETEPIDTIAGRIPGAVNRFHGQNLQPDGTFKPAAELRQEFQSLLDDTSPENAVVYCGSGVTSCLHLIAMDVAGLHGAKLYVGSWSEWIRDPHRPKA
jgi:thiosulfate/3-mercaptopyruvate sulfurtransferase